MLVAKVQNGQVGEIVDARGVFGVYADITESMLREQNFVRVNLFRAHDSMTEKLVRCEPVFEDGWVYAVEVQPKTAEDIEADKVSAAANVRAQRTKLLSACDWTQLADSTADKAAWGTYRQALRDVPSQPGFPWTIDWPVAP